MTSQDRLYTVISEQVDTIEYQEALINAYTEALIHNADIIGIYKSRIDRLAKENKKLKTDLERVVVKVSE